MSQLGNVPQASLSFSAQLSPYSSLGDDALVSLVQQGDESALATLFDRHAKVVYSVALRVLRDPSAAEDIMQEVFMQVWRAPTLFLSARGSFAGWLAVLARNRSIDALRGRKPCDPIDDLVLMSSCNVAKQCEQHLMIEKAQALMLQLPLTQQRVLELAFFDGLTHSEIAALTGKALGTIKSDIRRALLSMRKAAQHEYA